MTPQQQALVSSEVFYPESDGKPIADNIKQFRWIVVIKQNLEWLFADDPNVFVARNSLWYSIEGNNTVCTAPDAMVVFGRPKGDRGSYQQWKEDNLPPHVVFEVLSPGNTRREMDRKLLFHDRYGVEEYYIYDPNRIELSGWHRSDTGIDSIEEMNGWISPHLGIRFNLAEELELYRPDGSRFLSFAEISQQLANEQQRAEQERQRAEQAEQQKQEVERLLQQYRARFSELD
ncbi:Uma2 family endonuclease [Leptolyngbya sp. FACHB-17]|uniref:Uma2 family endonuclease n=1 Tax=unclassified Leptolyngbya TaxID=2650499 RepID=UPI001681A1FA|nr:Uma2 family endonuclease [Leptolyngbya sp. FACHB-17]MBD2081795.1 Uma2 family endonuclease [Leptolyngbya sp. FACHB-17]